MVRTPVHAAPALTEDDVIRIALAQPEREALLEFRRGLARSDLTAARAWPNPRVDYSREQVPRSFGNDINEFYWLSQDLDISGRRGLRREAATTRLGATDASATFERIEIASIARQRFFDLLHQLTRVAEYEVWLGRLGEVATLVAARETAGEASGYETLRIASEQASARLAREQELAHVQAAWTALETACGSVDLRTAYGAVVGELDPEPPPSLEAALAAVQGRPDFVAWRGEIEALELEERVSGRAWVPDLTVGVGSKRVLDDVGDDSGPMVALGLAVPLFDRGRAARQRSAAQSGAARSSYELALRAARGAVREAWEEASRLAGLARSRRNELERLAKALVRVAEVGYRGGELALIELLDAYQNEHEGRMQVLDLEAAARTAQLQLERLTRATPL